MNFAGVQQDRAAPPGLELKETFPLGVHLRIDIIGLGPVGVGWVQRFEVGDQMHGAVLA